MAELTPFGLKYSEAAGGYVLSYQSVTPPTLGATYNFNTSTWDSPVGADLFREDPAKAQFGCPTPGATVPGAPTSEAPGGGGFAPGTRLASLFRFRDKLQNSYEARGELADPLFTRPFTKQAPRKMGTRR